MYHYPKCPDNAFQFHHQPFNYYANYGPDGSWVVRTSGDEVEFDHAAQLVDGPVQPRRRSASSSRSGSRTSILATPASTRQHNHLIDLLKQIDNSACAKDTMVIVTYDEFGGQWDHVSPPGQGNNNGPHDQWGPGTRIPALVISPFLRGNFAVDHTQYDTTSILATIEQRYGLPPLDDARRAGQRACRTSSTPSSTRPGSNSDSTRPRRRLVCGGGGGDSACGCAFFDRRDDARVLADELLGRLVGVVVRHLLRR